jgi:hypothetical protein
MSKLENLIQMLCPDLPAGRWGGVILMNYLVKAVSGIPMFCVCSVHAVPLFHAPIHV